MTIEERTSIEHTLQGVRRIDLTMKGSRDIMANKSTLIVRFRIAERVKEEFLAKLREVFTHIVKEETFVEASAVEDMSDPEIILLYEVWDESPGSFMKEQMNKAYRAEFEKMIVDLKIERTPTWCSTLEDWKKALTS
jgi:quinol monooxygenase YgiN